MISRREASDGECMAVLAAEREVKTIRILAEHAGLSDVASDRIAYSLHVIGVALAVKRAECGLSSVSTREAA